MTSSQNIVLDILGFDLFQVLVVLSSGLLLLILYLVEVLYHNIQWRLAMFVLNVQYEVLLHLVILFHDVDYISQALDPKTDGRIMNRQVSLLIR